jgi:hypothetical protein
MTSAAFRRFVSVTVLNAGQIRPFLHVASVWLFIYDKTRGCPASIVILEALTAIKNETSFFSCNVDGPIPFPCNRLLVEAWTSRSEGNSNSCRYS